jgi:Glu-tRNA(Gln) amidotransferase subunit E-like FAD-binding protein
MNNAIVLKWTKDINARSGKSYTIFTRVSSRAGWASKAHPVHYEQDVSTAFDKAELVEDSVRVILHNTKSRITADNIDCYSLRTMIAAKRLNNIRTEMSKTALKISTVEKGSKLSVSQRRDQGSFDERSFERRCLELCEKPRPTMHQDSGKVSVEIMCRADALWWRTIVQASDP